MPGSNLVVVIKDKHPGGHWPWQRWWPKAAQAGRGQPPPSHPRVRTAALCVTFLLKGSPCSWKKTSLGKNGRGNVLNMNSGRIRVSMYLFLCVNPIAYIYYRDDLFLSLSVMSTTNLSRIIFSSLSNYNSKAKKKKKKSIIVFIVK